MMNEIEKFLEEVTLAVKKLLKENGAVRLADNKEADPDGLFVEDLLEKLEKEKGFSISQAFYYNHVRPKAIELGFGITAINKGQYLCSAGEALARNTHQASQQILGRTANQKKSLTAAGESMTLEEGNKYSKILFNMDLLQSAKLFEAVGKASNDPLLAWPPELKQYLIEASK